jgi:hypothetical protein
MKAKADDSPINIEDLNWVLSISGDQSRTDKKQYRKFSIVESTDAKGYRRRIMSKNELLFLVLFALDSYLCGIRHLNSHSGSFKKVNLRAGGL